MARKKKGSNSLFHFNKVLKTAKAQLREIRLSKKVIQISLIAAILVVSLGAAGVFGFTKLKDYQQGQAIKEQQYREQLQASIAEIATLREQSEQRSEELSQKLEEQQEQQQQLKEETQQKLTQSQLEAERKAEQARLEAQQEAARQRQLDEQRIQELEQKLAQSGYSLSNIVQEWSPIVAKITCEFRYGDTNALYQVSSGSGMVFMSSSSVSPTVMTNKHVVRDDEGFYADKCTVAVPNNFQSYHFYTDTIKPNPSVDFALATIIDSDITLRNLGLSYGAKPLCSAKPSIGEEVVILGYPKIGSQSSPTATEGIVSGFDGNYFITSAKVEQGNSGGAAILAKDNCLLGIPTAVAVGQVESLARILDINTVK